MRGDWMKHISTVATAAIAAGAGVAPAQGAGALPPGIPVLGAHQLSVRCDEELEARRKLLAAMERHHGPGGVLQELNSLAVRTGNFDNPVSLLQNASPDAETRAAATACLEKLLPFATELYQSTAVYERVAGLKPAD